MPAPLEDRFFTDWGSLGSGSPHVRMPPQSVPVREIGPDINQPDNSTRDPIGRRVHEDSRFEG